MPTLNIQPRQIKTDLTTIISAPTTTSERETTTSSAFTETITDTITATSTNLASSFSFDSTSTSFSSESIEPTSLSEKFQNIPTANKVVLGIVGLVIVAGIASLILCCRRRFCGRANREQRGLSVFQISPHITGGNTPPLTPWSRMFRGQIREEDQHELMDLNNGSKENQGS